MLIVKLTQEHVEINIESSQNFKTFYHNFIGDFNSIVYILIYF